MTTCSSAPTVACLASGFFPSPVAFSWSPSPSSGPSPIPQVQSSSGYFRAGSRLRIPEGSKSATCSVRHEATGQTRSEKVDFGGPAPTTPLGVSTQGSTQPPPGRFRPDPAATPGATGGPRPTSGDPAATSGGPDPKTLTTGKKPHPPTVDVFQTCGDSGLVSLLCLAEDFSPAPVSVAWLKGGAPLEPDHAHTEPPTAGHARGTFRVVSRLNVSMAEWRDNTFSCRVTHAASGAVREALAQRCSAPLCTSIGAFTLPPSPSDLYITQNPKILCVVTSLPSDEGLEVTWSKVGGGAVAQPLPLVLKHHFNGTFTATSALPVTTAEWEGGAAFECHVEHAELPSRLERRAQRRQGKRLAPSVYLLPPPPEELSGPRLTVSLTCLVRGFYPETLDLRWQRDQDASGGTGSDLTSAQTGSPLRENGADGAYFLYSRLEVTREEWERGTGFSCTVVHEGLPLRFVQRTVRKGPELLLPPDLCPEEPGGDPWDALGVLVTLFLLSVGYGATVTLCKVQWVLSSLLRLSVQQGA